MKILLIIFAVVIIACITVLGIIAGKLYERIDRLKFSIRNLDTSYIMMDERADTRHDALNKVINKHALELVDLKGSETNIKKDIATLFQYNQAGKNQIYGMHDVIESMNCDLKHVKEHVDKHEKVIMQIMLANLPEDMRDDLYDLRVDPMTGKVTAVTKYDTEMTLEELFTKKNTKTKKGEIIMILFIITLSVFVVGLLLYTVIYNIVNNGSAENFCYYGGFTMMWIGGLTAFFMVIWIFAVQYAGVDPIVQRNNMQYEALIAECEIIDTEYEDISKTDTIQRVFEWNQNAYTYNYWMKNPWTSWFYNKRVGESLKHINTGEYFAKGD